MIDIRIVIGCLLGDILIGMISLFILHRLFPKKDLDFLAFLIAGLMSITSITLEPSDTFFNIVIIFLVQTAISAAVLMLLWRLFRGIFNKRPKSQLSEPVSKSQSPEENLSHASSVTCPQCGYEQSGSNNYCRKCGVKLVRALSAQ